MAQQKLTYEWEVAGGIRYRLDLTKGNFRVVLNAGTQEEEVQEIPVPPAIAEGFVRVVRGLRP